MTSPPPKDWWKYHSRFCGTLYRGCAPECPARKYDDTGVWTDPGYRLPSVPDLRAELHDLAEALDGARMTAASLAKQLVECKREFGGTTSLERELLDAALCPFESAEDPYMDEDEGEGTWYWAAYDWWVTAWAQADEKREHNGSTGAADGAPE